MEWIQRSIRLRSRSRGFQVIISDVVDQLPELRQEVGVLHIQHTSASITINENVSHEVRRDMERHMGQVVPKGPHHYEHTLDGDDDMPAHIKASLFGSSVSIPVGQGQAIIGNVARHLSRRTSE